MSADLGEEQRQKNEYMLKKERRWEKALNNLQSLINTLPPLERTQDYAESFRLFLISNPRAFEYIPTVETFIRSARRKEPITWEHPASDLYIRIFYLQKKPYRYS